MKMPDGNSAAELDNDLSQTKADRAFAAFEHQAREDVREMWWRHMNLEDVTDVIYRLPAADEAWFLEACRRGHSVDAGELLTTALNRAADHYLDTDHGQKAIADRVQQLDQEEHE